MKAKYIMIATIATMLVACNNDENEVYNRPVEARVTAGMGTEARAVNDEPSSFAPNDEIGVMVTKVEQPSDGGTTTSGMVDRYKNMKYITKAGGTTAAFEAPAGEGIFFQDATETVTFAAYYPYQTSTDASTLPTIAVDTQNNNTTANQAKIDFLFASGATASKTTPKVEFKDNTAASGNNNQFLHKMTQLKLVVKASTSDGFTEDGAKAVCADASTYQLGGLIHKGTFTLKVESDGTATGTTAISPTASAVNDWTITGCVHTDNESEYTRTYTLILLPQDKNGSPLKFAATIGGQNYHNDKDINPNLEEGKTYTYTITIKKTGLAVSGCTIGKWEAGGTGSGNAEM